MSELLCEYHSLTGVSGGRLKGPISNTRTGILAALRKHRAVAAASDHGSVMAWIDDRGKYNANLCRFKSEVAVGHFNTKAELSAWLRVHLPKMRQHPAELSHV